MSYVPCIDEEVQKDTVVIDGGPSFCQCRDIVTTAFTVVVALSTISVDDTANIELVEDVRRVEYHGGLAGSVLSP